MRSRCMHKISVERVEEGGSVGRVERVEGLTQRRRGAEGMAV